MNLIGKTLYVNDTKGTTYLIEPDPSRREPRRNDRESVNGSADLGSSLRFPAVQLAGMTDQFDIGFFMKRARVCQELFGDSNYHADQLARMKSY